MGFQIVIGSIFILAHGAHNVQLLSEATLTRLTPASAEVHLLAAGDPRAVRRVPVRVFSCSDSDDTRSGHPNLAADTDSEMLMP